MTPISQEQRDYSELKPYQFKPGKSWNPGGRPKGSVTLKTWVQNMLLSMSDEERLDFLAGLDKETIWKMWEWLPFSHTDITSKGEALQPVLVKFIDAKDNWNTNWI